MLDIITDGVEIKKGFLSEESIAFIKADISLSSDRFKKYGIRNLEKKFDSIKKLAFDEKVLFVARSILKGKVKLVRALFFDKTPDKNWYVTWHQDKTVTLNKKVDLKGWHTWSLKDGVYHVQPPVSVLDNMLTLRLHIDSSDQENGCLKVIPGTHKHGILNQGEIDNIVGNSTAISCEVEASDVVIMRPHVLHSSSKASKPHHRRVVHLEYSSYELPEGVTWE